MHQKELGTEVQSRTTVNYHLFFENGAPYQFVAFNAPVEPSVYAEHARRLRDETAGPSGVA